MRVSSWSVWRPDLNVGFFSPVGNLSSRIDELISPRIILLGRGSLLAPRILSMALMCCSIYLSDDMMVQPS